MPILRFHLLTITHEQVNGSVTVTITTNAACHLYLRYSNIFPRIHRKSVARRGLVMGWDARYCFTVYQHLEQDEESDTWTHTFTWPGWENCNTRYFYFWGTMGGQDMVSDTPIFWIHYFEAEVAYGEGETLHFHPEQHPELVTCDGLAARIQYGVTWSNLHDLAGTAANSNVTKATARISSWSTLGKWYYIERAFFLFDTSLIPAGSLVVAATLHLFGTAKVNTLILASALNVFTSAPTTDTDIIPADYQLLGSTPLAIPIPYADFLTMDWNHLLFTEAGLVGIIPGGITKLAVRESNYDAPDIMPYWISYKHMYFQFAQSEGAEERWADLEVTFQPPL